MFPKKQQSNAIGRVLSYQRNNDIVKMLLAGRDKQDIIDFISMKYHVTLQTADRYIKEAGEEIKSRKRYELADMIAIHVARCEYIYTKLYELGAWFDAGLALKHKEKLLGFHREGFQMKVTQGEIHQVQSGVVQDDYDIKKLKPEQQERFNQLIEKAKSLSALKE
jgi:hypothetical protein